MFEKHLLEKFDTKTLVSYLVHLITSPGFIKPFVPIFLPFAIFSTSLLTKLGTVLKRNAELKTRIG